ncbi:ATP synthase delta chain, chloroplastic [Tanacetum coccineum]
MFSESSSRSPSESEEKTRHKLRRFSASKERNKIRMMELGPTLETKVCMSNFGTTTSSTGLDPEDIIIESLREGYAAALLDHAICTNSLEAVHKDVKKVLKWLKCNEMLKSVMGDVNVGESVKGMVVKEVVEKVKMRKQVVALVKMLVAKSKSGMVIGVMEEFERIYWELNNCTRRQVLQI